MAPFRYAYYPGCAAQEITRESDETTRVVAEMLGIELHAMPAANCCGAGLTGDFSYELNLALNARIFAQAEQMGMDILTICSTCLMVMNTVNRDLTSDPELLAQTNKVLAEAGLSYGGGVKTRHLLWVLFEEYGLKALRKKVKRPLSWLKVAPFYGCHSLRPSDALGVDDPERPRSLDAVIDALGAVVVDYEGKTKCCGFQVDLVAEDTALEMTAARLFEARDNGAECVVTPCPFCHINMDNYQGLAEKKVGRKISMPVFHLAQLVGLALGMDADKMGLTRHLVSPQALVSPP